MELTIPWGFAVWIRLCVLTEMSALHYHEDQCNGGGDHIGHGQGIEHTVLTEDVAENQHHGNQAENLAAEADENGFLRLADGLEEAGAYISEGNQGQQQIVYPHGIGGVTEGFRRCSRRFYTEVRQKSE